MHESQKSSRARGVLYSIVLAVMPLSACSGEVERRWSEEVPLDDGRVIVIERFVKFTESQASTGSAYSSTELESTLEFQGEFSSLAKWAMPLIPLVLYQDRSGGEWVIVATTSNCDIWYAHGSPARPYWEFHLQAGKWVQSQLSESSIGRKTNLFFSYEPSLPARKISREQKGQIIQRNDFAKKYLSISADAKTRCM